MDVEARRAAFAEAKAESINALARTAEIKVERRDHFNTEYWQRPDDPKPASTPQSRQPSLVEIEAMRAADWARFVDGRIAAALAAHDELWHDVLGAVIAEERKRMRAEIVTEVGQLRADITFEKAAERGDVVDLPVLPLRSQRRA